MLEIIDLHKSFHGRPVINGLNLEISDGKVFGFLGANGSGKTTTMKMVMGLLRADRGRILLDGQELKFGQPRQEIGFLPDVPAFYPYMTPQKYLRFCAQLSGRGEERIDSLLELVGLEDADRKIKGFSRGMKQRLGIAQALLEQPKLLLCDEPTSALDPIGRREILDILKKVSEQTTIVFSTHILVDVERICDSFGILKDGRMERSGQMSEISGAVSNRIKLELMEQAEAFAQMVKQLPGVSEVKIREQALLVVVSDMGRAQSELLSALDRGGFRLRKYEIAEPTLEEVFVEVSQ